MLVLGARTVTHDQAPEVDQDVANPVGTIGPTQPAGGGAQQRQGKIGPTPAAARSPRTGRNSRASRSPTLRPGAGSARRSPPGRRGATRGRCRASSGPDRPATRRSASCRLPGPLSPHAATPGPYGGPGRSGCPRRVRRRAAPRTHPPDGAYRAGSSPPTGPATGPDRLPGHQVRREPRAARRCELVGEAVDHDPDGFAPDQPPAGVRARCAGASRAGVSRRQSGPAGIGRGLRRTRAGSGPTGRTASTRPRAQASHR